MAGLDSRARKAQTVGLVGHFSGHGSIVPPLYITRFNVVRTGSSSANSFA